MKSKNAIQWLINHSREESKQLSGTIFMDSIMHGSMLETTQKSGLLNLE